MTYKTHFHSRATVGLEVQSNTITLIFLFLIWTIFSNANTSPDRSRTVLTRFGIECKVHYDHTRIGFICGRQTCLAYML